MRYTMYTMYKYILYVIIYHRRLIGQRGSSISGARGLSKNVLKKRHEDVKTRESYGTEMKYERRVLRKNGKKKKIFRCPWVLLRQSTRNISTGRMRNQMKKDSGGCSFCGKTRSIENAKTSKNAIFYCFFPFY